jgi:hypothetical protein
VLEVHEGVRGPQALSQLLASDQLTGSVHERAQYLEGLYGDLDPDALPSHLAGAPVDFKDAEAKTVRRG